MGAIPIDENWDGVIVKKEFDRSNVKTIQDKSSETEGTQLSLFN